MLEFSTLRSYRQCLPVWTLPTDMIGTCGWYCAGSILHVGYRPTVLPGWRKHIYRFPKGFNYDQRLWVADDSDGFTNEGVLVNNYSTPVFFTKHQFTSSSKTNRQNALFQPSVFPADCFRHYRWSERETAAALTRFHRLNSKLNFS